MNWIYLKKYEERSLKNSVKKDVSGKTGKRRMITVCL